MNGNENCQERILPETGTVRNENRKKWNGSGTNGTGMVRNGIRKIQSGT